MRNANHGRADGGISRGISADPVWQGRFSRGMPRIRGSRKGKRRKGGRQRDSKFMVVQPTSVSKFMSASSSVLSLSLSPSADHPVHESHNSKSPNYLPSLNLLVEYSRDFETNISRATLNSRQMSPTFCEGNERISYDCL